MTAFPQLGYGFKTNVRTLPECKPSFKAKQWWDNLSDENRIEIAREHIKFYCGKEFNDYPDHLK